MSDDPSDAFDKFADSIRSEQDELEAADALRREKAAERSKQKQTSTPPAGGEEPPPTE